MTDDLVGRLRTTRLLSQRNQLALQDEAAARIEALEGENRKLRATLEFMRDTPNVAYRLTAKEALGEPLSWEERNGWDERG